MPHNNDNNNDDLNDENFNSQSESENSANSNGNDNGNHPEFPAIPIVYQIKIFDAINQKLASFHFLGRSFREVYENVAYYCNQAIGDGGWELLKITMKPNIQIVNVYDYVDGQFSNEHFIWEGGSDCPLCIVESGRIELDRIMKFNCVCGTELVIGDTGWTICLCPACQNEILRKDIIRNEQTGILIYTKSEGNIKGESK